MPTYSACEIGAIGNVAGTFTTIGSTVTLAQGGPWEVWAMGANIVTGTATPDERYGGQMRIDPVTPQDWSPVPTPCQLPTVAFSSGLGTTGQLAWAAPTTMWPVSFQARGGTTVNIQAAEAISNAAAAIAEGHFFYGSRPAWADNPRLMPFQTVRVITGSVDATAETSIGTVQIGTGDTRIVYIGEVGAVDDTLSADQEVVYRLRLTSEDTDISNFRFPGSSSAQQAADATPDAQGIIVPQMWPVDIPVKPNSTLEVLADHQIATGTVHQVFIATA